MTKQSNAQIPVIILAGGQGTRLRELDDTRPKPMVLVNEKPFLYWLIRHHIDQGFREFILSTCHMAEQIENHPWSSEFPGCKFEFYREATPLGTGGAIQAIFAHFRSISRAWVINGDTLLPTFLPSIDQGSEAVYCVLNENEVFDATPNLIVRGKNIVGESSDPNEGEKRAFDAGAVFTTRKAVERCALHPPFSFHKLMNQSMQELKVGFHVLEGTCYDIGTPQRYERFSKYLRSKNT